MSAHMEATARRRANTALDDLEVAVNDLRTQIVNDLADGDDTQRIASLTRDLIQQVSILGALREAREEADT